MKSKFKNLIKFSPVTFVFIIAILFVIFYLVYIIVGWNGYLTDEAGRFAKNEAQQQSNIIDTQLEQLMANIEEVASDFAVSKDEAEFKAKMAIINNSTPFSYFRYFKNGELYTDDGSQALKDSLTSKYIEAPEVMAFAGTQNTAMSVDYIDKIDNACSIAFYVPIVDNDLMDGFVGVYNVRNLDKLLNYKEVNSKAVGYSMVRVNGDVVFGNFSGTISNTSNLYTFLNGYASSSAIDIKIEAIKEDINKDSDGYVTYTIEEKDYVFAYSIIDVNNQKFVFVKMYLATDIANDVLKAPVTLTGVLITASLFFIIIILYQLFINNKYNAYMSRFANIDDMLGCSNYAKFQKDAVQIINENKNAKFALFYISIRQYSYMKEHFGEEKCNQTLLFISETLKKFLSHNETYGHVHDDNFVVLMYFNETQEVIDRFNVIYSIIYNFAFDKEAKYNIRLSAGVFCIDKNNNSNPITDMIDRAIDAKKVNNLSAINKYTIYDDSTRKEFNREASLESKMQLALEQMHFKVYLQPKQNLNTERIEGAEALVRWDDIQMGQIMPNDFIPLFERNGFIEQLDKFMYISVCKYISDYVKQGKRVVPISVNVSRVTAIKENFVEFYVNTKNKYGIADKFLMLEFTESFAYENYDVIRKIIHDLRKNGIMCSVDDFGSGYSSLNLIKEITMDELKMDRSFLKQGIDSKRDDIMISTIIKMAKNFGMKVTQEGVETIGEKERLKKLGCDVIQGYYYARPMSKEDFGEYLHNLMMHYKD